MPTIAASASATIPVASGTVYDLLADYHDGHPRILPAQYFSDLVVERGGHGAGTHIRFNMHAFGRVHPGRMVVDEPEPGRVLTETDPANGVVTTFTVEPEGTETRVTISTRWTMWGVTGWFAWLVMPRYLRNVYAAELAQLAAVARQRQALMSRAATAARLDTPSLPSTFST